MFYYLKGIAAHVAPNLAVIDCGGVGYACRTTSYTLSALQVGQEAKLYTHLNVREDAMELYGFATENEKNCFQMLISVSGVGPKAALSILSANTPEGLAQAIMNNNEKALTVAPGIGKKIAQRVILELKDKIAKDNDPVEMQLPVHSTPAESSAVNDAVAALTVLGYSSSEIAPALKKIDTAALSTEQIIKAVLKQMVK